MPPRLPDRYELQVRLGRDGDVEEWLATDTALDRPVLVRVLGPESTPQRRSEFLEAVRGAAAVTHTHIAAVFAADHLEDGAYSVSEWAGGVTLAHRSAAGDTMPVPEFLPNAAGLADAVAALHSVGVLHGSIDEGSIFYSIARPAKLAAFGRRSAGATATQDVRDLARTLAVAVAGPSATSVPPSQTVDGLSPAIDLVLDRAQGGELDASNLAELLRAAPTSTTAPAERGARWSWKWALPVAILLAVALGLFFFGRSLETGPQSPFLFPVGPSPEAEPPPTTPPVTTTTQAVDEGERVTVLAVRVFDPPPGDGIEHDRELENLSDGDPTTAWTTERYFDPLSLVKEGVGVIFELEGSPASIEISGAADATGYRILWAAAPQPTLAGWEQVASGTIRDRRALVQLPPRENGSWLLWLTDLPADPDGGYVGTVGEVRFRT